MKTDYINLAPCPLHRWRLRLVLLHMLLVRVWVKSLTRLPQWGRSQHLSKLLGIGLYILAVLHGQVNTVSTAVTKFVIVICGT